MTIVPDCKLVSGLRLPVSYENFCLEHPISRNLRKGMTPLPGFPFHAPGAFLPSFPWSLPVDTTVDLPGAGLLCPHAAEHLTSLYCTIDETCQYVHRYRSRHKIGRASCRERVCHDV